jgi:hypothetical protein
LGAIYLLDQPMKAAFLGALSTIPYEMLTRILISLGFAKYSVYELSSLMITINRPTKVLGSFLSMILGASIAVILYYILESRVGWDQLILKSIFISLQSWVLLEGLFMWLIEGRKFIPLRPLSDYYSHFISVSVFGFTLGLLFRRCIKNK